MSTKLVEMIDALVAMNESGAAVPRIPGLAVELLSMCRRALVSFDGWPEDAEFRREQWVEKFTGEARWEGRVVSAYHTTAGKLRYVVEVKPQGFQMIAVPEQLRDLPPRPAEVSIVIDTPDWCSPEAAERFEAVNAAIRSNVDRQFNHREDGEFGDGATVRRAPEAG